MKIDIVYSAPNMLRLQQQKYMTAYPDNWRRILDAICAGASLIKADAAEKCHLPVTVSLLYNAYNESTFGGHARNNRQFGFDYLYADSGGLQVITAGKQISDEIKTQLYHNQSYADYGFCFDEIPVVNYNGGSRSDTASKEFVSSRLEECAIKTAKNINEQINKLKEIGSKTKIFYIVQGNDYESMVKWVEYGFPYIEDKSMIAGWAMADTCIGNSTLESIDMLIAYAMIDKMTDYRYNNVHFLGVGSVSRLEPMIQFSRAGIIRDDVTLSFDSSTLSLSWMYGRILTPDGNMSLSTVADIRKFVVPVLDYLWPTLSTHITGCTRDECVAYLEANFKSLSKLTSIDTESPVIHVMRAFVPLLCVYQSVAISQSISMFDSPTLNCIGECSSIDEIITTRNAIKSTIPSKRIQRDHSKIEDFFA